MPRTRDQDRNRTARRGGGRAAPGPRDRTKSNRRRQQKTGRRPPAADTPGPVVHLERVDFPAPPPLQPASSDAPPVEAHPAQPPGQAVLLYVVGGAGAGAERSAAVRDFPLVQRGPGQAETAHLMRVARLLDDAHAAGGTHLHIPFAAADWLVEHPLLADYLREHFALVEATTEGGIVFAWQQLPDIPFRAEVRQWQVAAGAGIALSTDRRLPAPGVSFLPLAPARGLLRGHLRLRASALRTLRLGFVLTRPDRHLPHRRALYLSLARPGFLIHDLPFVDVTFAEDGAVDIDFDLKLARGRVLERIELTPVEEDNWQLHPMYPGGRSFRLPDAAPAGSKLTIEDLNLQSTPRLRAGVPYGTVHAQRPAPYRKPCGRPRDAVIFSSWVPKEGLALGDYFIKTLEHWHGDSKIFVGINHGSTPQWRKNLEASQLDVTVVEAPTTITMPCDPTGFVTALAAFRRDPEPFDLVWFGHTKGLGHVKEVRYGTGRWAIERMYWSRRREIEQYFRNPVIGLYSPHYLMMLQDHLRQTDALERMYDGPCAPLGAMAVSTHYVMRNESVRAFCANVDPKLFREGPEAFGGDMYFFEMAMSNVPSMQGYEPYIEPGLGGTSGAPKLNGIESILRDWRQNNAVVAIELEKWRQNPTSFRTRHSQHNRVD